MHAISADALESTGDWVNVTELGFMTLGWLKKFDTSIVNSNASSPVLIDASTTSIRVMEDCDVTSFVVSVESSTSTAWVAFEINEVRLLVD
jgi:hypothetical protein